MNTSLCTRGSRGPGSLFERERVRSLQEEMDEVLSRFSHDWAGDRLPHRYPALDLTETSDAFQLRVDVPGISPENIDLKLTGTTLRMAGKRKTAPEVEGTACHRRERRSGEFSRTVSPPCAVQEDQIHADCRDGVLTVTIPKAAEAKPRRIHVSGR